MKPRASHEGSRACYQQHQALYMASGRLLIVRDYSRDAAMNAFTYHEGRPPSPAMGAPAFSYHYDGHSLMSFAGRRAAWPVR